MKIAIFSDLAPPYLGGGETYVSNLGARLAEWGHEVHWVSSQIAGTKKVETYKDITIHRIPILFSRRFIFPGRQTFVFTSVLHRLGFLRTMDIVQSNTLVAGYTGWWVAKRAHKPSLLFCHEFFGDLWKTIGQNLIEKHVYPVIEKQIAGQPYQWYACPSQFARITMINAGVPNEKITVIPHGVDCRLFNGEVDGSYFRKLFGLGGYRLFGYLGRLRVQRTGQSKNLLMLLEAARIVAKHVPNSRLVLAGGGYHELAAVVKKMGLEGYVIHIGDIPYELNPKFLKLCDVVVCPSLSDGFCFLTAEASACGVPVVATNRGAHPERVINERTGLLAETTPYSLAQAIIDVLMNEQRAKELGLEGQKFSTNLQWEDSCRKHLEIYKHLVKTYGA